MNDNTETLRDHPTGRNSEPMVVGVSKVAAMASTSWFHLCDVAQASRDDEGITIRRTEVAGGQYVTYVDVTIEDPRDPGEDLVVMANGPDLAEAVFRLSRRVQAYEALGDVWKETGG